MHTLANKNPRVSDSKSVYLRVRGELRFTTARILSKSGDYSDFNEHTDFDRIWNDNSIVELIDLSIFLLLEARNRKISFKNIWIFSSLKALKFIVNGKDRFILFQIKE